MSVSKSWLITKSEQINSGCLKPEFTEMFINLLRITIKTMIQEKKQKSGQHHSTWVNGGTYLQSIKFLMNGQVHTDATTLEHSKHKH